MEVPNDWESSVRVSSSNCSVMRKQKESKPEEVWADRVWMRWRTSYFKSLIKTPNEGDFALVLELKN